jgi:transcriptional regulator with GAF, ATPase, and Fis domain
LLTRLAALQPFIAESPAMRDLIVAVERASEAAATVLITGETGVGKELISRAVHALSDRREREFIPFDCATVNRELIESELFGHRRGSFTGAIGDRPGLIREAEGGTLFLDEIGELSLETQKKFLRFLQEREVRPVGADRPFKADVRVIAATNRDLEAEVRAGRFRLDLYERLNVLRLRIPPLRERREEIPLLAEQFLELFQQQVRRQGQRLSDETMESLLSYHWPGNVRELQNEIHRLVVSAKNDEVIGPERLSPVIRAGTNAQPTPAAAIVEGRAMIDLNLPLREAIDQMERLFITNALEKTGGNISQAAARLQMSRYGLGKAMARYGIKVERNDIHPSGE